MPDGPFITIGQAYAFNKYFDAIQAYYIGRYVSHIEELHLLDSGTTCEDSLIMTIDTMFHGCSVGAVGNTKSQPVITRSQGSNMLNKRQRVVRNNTASFKLPVVSKQKTYYQSQQFKKFNRGKPKYHR